MSIAPDVIESLAGLSRIELTPGEQKTFSQQLPKVVEYVGQLQTVETHEVALEDEAKQPLRADAVEPCADPDALLAQAPDAQDHSWKVKSVW